MYQTYCLVCHGADGAGDGPLISRKFPTPPPTRPPRGGDSGRPDLPRHHPRHGMMPALRGADRARRSLEGRRLGADAPGRALRGRRGGVAMRPLRIGQRCRAAIGASRWWPAGVALRSALRPPRVWTDLLIDGFYFLSLALAGMVFLAIHSWRARGGPTGCAASPRRDDPVPLAALPMLARLCSGRRALYPWTRPEVAARAGGRRPRRLSHEPFFLVRMVAVPGDLDACSPCCCAAPRWRRTAIPRRQRAAQHRRIGAAVGPLHRRLRLTFSLASFDWLMSLDPRWTSTMFAVYVFAGLFVAGHRGDRPDRGALLRGAGRWRRRSRRATCTTSASCCSPSAPSGRTSGSASTC